MGSGKSSLAFDTIYAEGQRRYVESLSSYARQFLGVMDKPDVDSIEGLSPAISIDQKSTSHNPRSTVGTVTEIYDYLRLLFARIGHPHCPTCGREISRQTLQQIVEQVLKLVKGPHTKLMFLAPVVRDRKGEFSGLLDNLSAKGYRHIRVDGHFVDIHEDIVLIKTNKHTIDVVVDKLVLTPKLASDPTVRSRISDSVEQALSLSDGLVTAAEVLDASFTIPDKPKKVTDHVYSENFPVLCATYRFRKSNPARFLLIHPTGRAPPVAASEIYSPLIRILCCVPSFLLRKGAFYHLAACFSMTHGFHGW